MDLLDLAQTAQDVHDDNAGGSGSFKPPEPGFALLRMCSYIELGTFETEWKGKAKKSNKVIAEFELVHDKHKITNKDGEFIGYHRITLRLNKSGHVNSRFMKLFACLNYDGKAEVQPETIPSLARFIGKPFIGTVHHNTRNEKTYANLDKDGVYSIQAPMVPEQDSMGVPTGKMKEVPVPEMHSPLRLFLWEAPGMPDSGYHKMWDSIYIEGEKEDGTSKNWIQETILSPENLALPGSTVERLFMSHVQELHDEFIADDPSLA